MGDMNSEGDVVAADAGQAGDAPAPKRGPRARRTRQVISWVLVVLASLLIPISVISAWAIHTVTNTDQYVATMAPLARNQVIVDHLATKATDTLFSSKVVQNKITDALPAKAKPIVQPITNQVKNYVYGLALSFFESEQFGKLWDTLNRHTHDAVVDILTGKQSELTKKLEKGGAIAVNVTPALSNIIDKANARGVTLFNPLKPILTTGNGLGVTIVSKNQVSKFSGIFNLLVKLGWAVPVIALILGVLSIVVAVGRRRALLRVSMGVALFTVVLLGVLSYGRGQFLHYSSVHSFDRDVAAAVWDTLLRFLKTDLRWTLLVSVLVAFGAWVAGPARYAVAIRSACVRTWNWLVAQARRLSGSAGRAAADSSGARRTGGWIVEHLGGLRVAGVVVAAIVLLLSGDLTGWSLIVMILVLAVYLGLLQLVATWARRVSGTAEGAPAT
jgi:hypothetical protein